jgi:hypothetical protein
MPSYVTIQVLEKLQAIFAGFEENGSEPLYIIMGSFISRPVTRALGGRETIQAAFDALGDIIVKFPRQAENAKFLLVPGTFSLVLETSVTALATDQAAFNALLI